MSQTTLVFTFAHGADAGARSYQEDALRVCQPGGEQAGAPVLAVLADGMGGHLGGEIASNLAIERYVDAFSPGKFPCGLVGQRLERSLIAANDGISAEVLKNPSLHSMGCTLVAAYIDRDGLRWVSVGDSSLLLYRGGEVRRLNEDHSVGALLDLQVRANLMTAEEARNDPRRHMLRSALTGYPIPIQQIVSEPEKLRPGDWVILASDGLDTLAGEEIAAVINRFQQSGEPAEVVRELLAEVRSRADPHQDNISVIAIRISDLAQSK